MTRRKSIQPATLSAPRPLALRRPDALAARVCLTLVGCGGTGSHIASGLVSLAQALWSRAVTADILFIDPDVVEPKNVGRQLFSMADVGRPKAQVLAERLNAAFATTTGYAVRKVDALDTFMVETARRDVSTRHAVSAPRDVSTCSVVIGAVDNAAARRVIARSVRAAKGRVWWLDAGNENASGQVALGNSFAPISPRLGLVADLPAPPVVYPDLVRSPSPRGRGRSCADLAAEGVQGLMVNRMAAAWALALLHDFLLGDLKYFAVAFDLARGNSCALPLDVETLQRFQDKSTRRTT